MSETEIQKPKAVCKNCGYEWTPRNPNGKHRFKCSKCGAENVELVSAANPQPETPAEPEQTPETIETTPEKQTAPEKTPEISKPSTEEIAAIINEPPREKPREAKRAGDKAANPEEETPQAGAIIPNIHPVMAVFLLIGLFGIGAIIYFRTKRHRQTKKSRRNHEKQQREATAQPIYTNPQPKKGIVGL